MDDDNDDDDDADESVVERHTNAVDLAAAGVEMHALGDSGGNDDEE